LPLDHSESCLHFTVCLKYVQSWNLDSRPIRKRSHWGKIGAIRNIPSVPGVRKEPRIINTQNIMWAVLTRDVQIKYANNAITKS